MVTVTINGTTLSVPEETTILDAAKSIGMEIPTLCYLKQYNEIGGCRICLVEIEGFDRLATACNTAVEEGMVIYTHSARALEARRINLQLLMSQHDQNCLSCVRSENCKLQQLCREEDITTQPFEKDFEPFQWNTNWSLIRDASKCVKCMRCVNICDQVQANHVWQITGTGKRTTITPAFGTDLPEMRCALCGQCITHCPTGALTARDDCDKVFDAIADDSKTVVVQIAPSVRTAWGSAFGLAPEDSDIDLLAAALKKAGADYVFSTDFSADLTIMEEGSEFLGLFTSGKTAEMPLFTSCCPGWVRYVNARFPKSAKHLSSAKSPQQMLGAMIKSYFAEQNNIDPKSIYSVSIMPCVAKKSECAREDLADACGDPDVDVVLTTREVTRFLKRKNIDVAHLQPVELDQPMQNYTGAGSIFGATGGVMEAALRSAYFLATNTNANPDAFKEVRASEDTRDLPWREATFDIGDSTVHVAITSGLGNAEKLVSAIEAGDVHYDFVEIMACPGGCVGGGGQPIVMDCEMAQSREEVLRRLDSACALRRSHDNPDISKIYDEFLGEPLSHKAHDLLHVHH
jgi:NADP-reducing hydrogenase subunit HndD